MSTRILAIHSLTDDASQTLCGKRYWEGCGIRITSKHARVDCQRCVTTIDRQLHGARMLAESQARSADRQAELDARKVDADRITALRMTGWTNIGNVANLLGSDYPPSPTPVHIGCFERKGANNGYTRVLGAERTIVRRPGQRNAWHTLRDEDGYHNLPDDTRCYFCGEII